MNAALAADIAAILRKMADASQDWGESARDGCNADLQSWLAAGNQIRVSPCEASFRNATWKLFDAAYQALWQLSHRMAKTLEGDYLVVVNHLRDLARPTGDTERDFALWGPIFFADTCRDLAQVIAAGLTERDQTRHDSPSVAQSLQAKQAAITDGRGQSSETASRKPLTKRAALIYEKLGSLKELEAMTLPEIQDWYADKTNKELDEGTWKRIRRELVPYGLRNRRNVGYYIREIEPPETSEGKAARE